MSEAYRAFRAAADALQAEWDATPEGKEHARLFQLIGARAERYRAERKRWIAENSAAMQADVADMHTRMRALQWYPAWDRHNERWREICAQYEAAKKAEREAAR